jgi:hypothetical protein
LYKFQNGSNPPERAYDLKTNKLADNYTGFIALCNQLAQPFDANFEANIQKVINVKDYMKALAIDVALGNWDSYSINKNNFFLYQNSITGRFEFITYDADNTFGIRWGSADYGNLSVDKWVSKNRPLANKLLAVPSFRAQYIDNLRFICDKITHPDSINPRITAMKSMIQAAAVSDKYRTKDWGYTMTNLNDSYTKPIDDHTPYGLKTFLTTRCTSIYKQTTPTIDGQSWDAELLLFPNPASETLWLSLPQVSDQIFDCKIYNILGKKVLETTLQLGENGQQISIEHLPKGQYCILLMLDNQVFTNKKFIKI